MKFSPETAGLYDVLRWRRDVRHFRPDPIPETVLTQLADVMALAPSVGNARPWRVIRVETPDTRAAVRAIFAAENARAAKGYDGETQAAYLRLKLAGLDIAPVHLAVFTDTDPKEGRGLGRQTMPETLMQSTVMAIHTLWLAARAHNLGMGMVSIIDPVRVAALFDVPSHWHLTGYLCLGYPQETDDTPLLHRSGWQENRPTRWIIQ